MTVPTAIETMTARSERWSPGARQAPDARIGMLEAPLLGRSALGLVHDPDGTLDSEDHLAAMIHEHVRRADLWWCSSEMVDLIEAASPTMPPQVLDHADPPSIYGLAILQKPHVEDDVNMPGRKVWTNAVLWHPAAGHYTPSHQGYDQGKPIPLLNIVSLAWIGAPLGWWVVGMNHWLTGQTQAEGKSPDDCADRARLATLWTLAGQKRDETAVVRPGDRPTRRRLARAGLPPEAGDVRLLDLRRPSGVKANEDTGHVDYSHRWIVSGHWRNQWLPSRGMHRAQWIAPHVKGPDDKPLVIRDDVKVVA